ncbi:hypothetical protein [Pseudonocardia hierapolitana]|uniref:hypothetical protein n=1 Tax=Pseudonocardia hierapolitana TaxID=1128676 RepID=UPI001FE298BC|nr:hypothetical protein [Pseudonocardia hierapolitana]
MTSTGTAAEVHERARQAYRVSVAAGTGLSGKALGERFGRSERWGRERIAEVRSAPPRPERRADGGAGRDDGERGAGAAAVSESARQPHGTETAIDVNPAGDGAAPMGARFVAWLGFVFGSAMSVAANVLHVWLPADERPAGWTPGIAQQVGSAVWPVGLLLSAEVLSRVRWAPGCGGRWPATAVPEPSPSARQSSPTATCMRSSWPGSTGRSGPRSGHSCWTGSWSCPASHC